MYTYASPETGKHKLYPTLILTTDKAYTDQNGHGLKSDPFPLAPYTY